MTWDYNITPTHYAPPTAAQPNNSVATLNTSLTAAPSERGSLLSEQEYQKIQSEIKSYDAYPEISSAFVQLVSNQSNPEQVVALLREAVDVIEQVRKNPHREIPGIHPALHQVVEEVRAVELQKPDPLNALRGQQGEIVPVLALAVADISTAVLADPLAQASNVESKRLNDLIQDQWRRRDTQAFSSVVPAFVSSSVTLGNSLSTAEALDFVRESGPTPGLPNLKGSGAARSGPDFA